MERPELEPYIGQTIDIEAHVTSRADSVGRAYGFLLGRVTTPSGDDLTDHAWLQIIWPDLAAVSGSTIRGRALIQKYFKAGRIDGHYEECAEIGTGIGDLDDVAVLVDGEWVPLEAAATRVRKRRAAKIKTAKADGSYVWPGTWTYVGGVVAVRAAESAKPGSLCDVRSRNSSHDKRVVLTLLEPDQEYATSDLAPPLQAPTEFPAFPPERLGRRI
jgi:hypothetical protein